MTDKQDNSIDTYMLDAYDPASATALIKKFLEKRHLYQSAIRELNTKLEILDDDFSVKYTYNPIHHIEHRLKTPKSILDKAMRKGIDPLKDDIDAITDIAGIRVICNYRSDVYAVEELLSRQSDIKIIRRKDYIKAPKSSGYRSLHLLVEVPVFLSDGVTAVIVEVQLRSIAMDTWASLEHELKYKRHVQLPYHFQKKLRDCAQRMEKIDMELQHLHDLMTNSKDNEYNNGESHEKK